MRTTVTLDPDVEMLLRQVMRERGQSFKEILNDSLRQVLTGSLHQTVSHYELKPRPMGLRPSIDLTKANQMAADLEDEEIIRKISYANNSNLRP